MERKHVHCGEVSSTEAVKILRRSDSNDGLAPNFGTYTRSFPQAAIVSKVGLANEYQS